MVFRDLGAVVGGWFIIRMFGCFEVDLLLFRYAVALLGV